MSDFSKLRIAVLRGGTHPEYHASLTSGEHVLSILRTKEKEFEPIDIFISRDGEWHRRGLVVRPEEALKHTDLAWNASRGAERMLESIYLPYVGSGSISSLIANTPHRVKEVYEHHNLRTPAYTHLDELDAAAELIDIFRRFMHPVAIRSAARPRNPLIAHSYHELEAALRDSFLESRHALVEEHMRGKRVVAYVLRGGRGESLYSFMPIELVSNNAVPSSASVEEHKEINDMAKRAHEAFGLGQISASTFVITPRGNVYILETDPLPDISKGSAFHTSIASTGWQPSDFVEHAIREAFKDQ